MVERGPQIRSAISGSDYAIRLVVASGLNGILRSFPFRYFPRRPRNLPMEIRALGRSSLASARLAYGCWSLAGSEGCESRTLAQQHQGIAAVHAAAAAGYTLFDLPGIYGSGE